MRQEQICIHTGPHPTRSLIGQDALVEGRVFFEYSNILLEKVEAANHGKECGFLQPFLVHLSTMKTRPGISRTQMPK
jgi:hypothetical protein